MVVTVTTERDANSMVTRDDAAPFDYCAAEVAAAAPAEDGRYHRLLDEVVRRLAIAGAEPTAALAVAGQVVRDTTWAGYRNGRARLASAAASYLTWLAPPGDWKYTELSLVGERRPVGWRSPDGELVVDFLDVAPRAIKACVRGVEKMEMSPVAIRALDLMAPTRSTAYLGTAAPVALAETRWWFAGGAR